MDIVKVNSHFGENNHVLSADVDKVKGFFLYVFDAALSESSQ